MFQFNIDLNRRIFGFDLIRSLAIIFVMLGHSSFLLESTSWSAFPWIKFPQGVDIFFVLSGFLIGYSFISNLEKGAINEKRFTFSFWKRALFRILPNYYLILFINYLLVSSDILPGNTETFNLYYFITFTQNLFTPFHSFFWESWSLAVQEWFYLLFPLSLFIFSSRFALKKRVLVISIFFILFTFLYRHFLAAEEYNYFWWDVTFRKVVFTRIDTIFYGVLAAWIRFYYFDYWNKLSKVLFSIGLLLFMASVFIPKDPSTYYTKVFYFSLASMGIAFWLPLLDQWKKAPKQIHKTISKLSILSYSAYLTNLLFAQLIEHNWGIYATEYPKRTYFMFWLITLVSSFFLYFIWEKPFYKLGRKSFGISRLIGSINKRK